MNEKTKELFDSWALEGRDTEMEKGHRYAAREALRLVTINSNATILDLGCGNGFVTRALAKRLPDATVLGVDMSDEMIHVARDLTDDDMLNCAFYCGTILDEMFDDEDQRFDLIFGMESIYYMVPVEGHIHRLSSLLSPAGQMLLVLDYYTENKTSHEWPEKYGVEMELHSGDEYVAMFERAGLVEVTQGRVRYPAGKGHEAWKVQEGSLMISGYKPGLSGF